MSEKRKVVTFYHSMVCPRCHVSGLLLKRALRKHPGIELTRVEVLTNRDRARRDGVRSIPALVANGRTLAGMILTPRAIEQFLEQLDADPG